MNTQTLIETPKQNALDEADAKVDQALAALEQAVRGENALRAEQEKTRAELLQKIEAAHEDYNTRAEDAAQAELAYFASHSHPNRDREVALKRAIHSASLAVERALQAYRVQVRDLALGLANQRADRGMEFFLRATGGDTEAARQMAESLPNVQQAHALAGGILTHSADPNVALRLLRRMRATIESELARG